jgi:hypothetical protein
VQLQITLQGAYDLSSPATIELSTGKDLSIISGATTFSINSTTGNVSLGTGSLSASSVLTTSVNTTFVNGINFSAFYTAFANHVASDNLPKHTADQISTDPADFNTFNGTTVTEVLQEVETALSNAGGAVRVYEHVQLAPADVWVVQHNQSSIRVQVTLWDNDNQMFLADAVTIVNADTIEVSYNTPCTGRAVLVLF